MLAQLNEISSPCILVNDFDNYKVTRYVSEIDKTYIYYEGSMFDCVKALKELFMFQPDITIATLSKAGWKIIRA
jgi:hypothetical protein